MVLCSGLLWTLGQQEAPQYLVQRMCLRLARHSAERMRSLRATGGSHCLLRCRSPVAIVAATIHSIDTRLYRMLYGVPG